MKTYPDTRAGARQLLLDEGDYDKALFSRAQITPDPYVVGVWIVRLADGTQLVVYVGSHQWAPDFEETYPAPETDL